MAKLTSFKKYFKDDLYRDLNKKNITEDEFVELLKLLKYNDEQIEQLLVKFKDGETLEAQEQTWQS